MSTDPVKVDRIQSIYLWNISSYMANSIPGIVHTRVVPKHAGTAVLLWCYAAINSTWYVYEYTSIAFQLMKIPLMTTAVVWELDPLRKKHSNKQYRLGMLARSSAIGTAHTSSARPQVSREGFEESSARV